MLELEEGNPTYAPRADGRPLLPVPPPVRLLAVSDVTLLTPPGQEKWLDVLFLRVLSFEPFDPANPGLAIRYAETIRSPANASPRLPGKSPADLPPPPGPRHYRAENFVLHYEVVGKLTAEQIRVVQVEVPQLEETVRRLLEAQVPYERIRGLLPGLVQVQVTDPAGNLIEISEGRRLPL